MIFNSIPDRVGNEWSLSFTLHSESPMFRLFAVCRDDKIIFQGIHNSNRTVSISLGNEADGKQCVRLTARLCEGENRILLTCRPHKVQLLLNGRVADEDFPLHPFELCGATVLENAIGAEIEMGKVEDVMPYEVGSVTTIDRILEDGINCYFGDCMPMSHNGIFHLFYLYDRRRHGSKAGYSGHQWAHISTTDLLHWTRHPYAVTIDRNEEATFRTGSVTYYKGKYYAYYVSLRVDGSPSPVTYSVSEDGIHFTKSEKCFYLDAERYDAVGLRDPKVVIAEDGSLHMFLSTKQKTVQGLKGCMLHLTSEDMEHWQIDEQPFFTVPLNEYPECPDYFKMGEYYYFCYNLYSVSHYMKSKKPFSDFSEEPDSLLGGNGFVVPQTAMFGSRRIAAAFSWTPYMAYAGEPCFLEIQQQENGRLSFVIPKELC